MTEVRHPQRPLVSLLLITYKQERTVGEALAAALAQTYSPLEIIVSDDASPDGSYEVMRKMLATYEGPHRVHLHRNERNLGVGGNLYRAVTLSSGELLVQAAGDDVSVPNRCERLADVWIASGCKLDLLASDLVDIDDEGDEHGLMSPSDLGTYAGPDDWLARRPYVIGAAQAWTRRLFERFGPLPEGVVAEDLIMAFRAICSGGAVSIREPLVRYRRGGLSRRVRSLSAADTAQRLLSNNRHALVELEVLKQDARTSGCEAIMQTWLDAEWAHATFIRDVFSAPDGVSRINVALRAHGVPWPRRLRILTYAAAPALLGPWFWMKRRIVGRG